MAGRRGGKTVWEIAEVGVTCVDDGGLCGWGAPNFPVLRAAWRDIKAEFAQFIQEVRESEWTIHFKSGGMLECWSFDSGIVARSREYHKFVIDEAGLIRNLDLRFRAEVEPTLATFDGTLVAGSTPNLVGPDLVKWFRLGQKPGSGWKSWRWSSLDNPAVSGNMAKTIDAARREGVPEWVIRQEYFAEPAEAGSGFFPEHMVEAHKERHACDPIARGSVVVPLRWQAERDAILMQGKAERIQWLPDDRGNWRLWFGVLRGRPEIRTTRACMGVDIGCGVGASNSVISAGDSDTGEKWAEFASAGDSPEELARIAAAFGYWIGGKDHPARINFDATGGAGEQFAKVLRQLEYPNLYIRRRSAIKVQDTTADEYGLVFTQKTKWSLFSEYRSALTNDAMMNPSAVALDECLQYHQVDDQKVVHQRELADGTDDSGAAVPHGDRCVADGLLHQCMASNPISDDPKPKAPKGSLVYFEEHEFAEPEAEG